MLGYGFDSDMIAGLIRSGLAMARRENMKAGDRAIEVVRIGITGAGRDALPAEGGSPRTGGPGRRRGAAGSLMTYWAYLTAPIRTHTTKQILDASVSRARE